WRPCGRPWRSRRRRWRTNHSEDCRDRDGPHAEEHADGGPNHVVAPKVQVATPNRIRTRPPSSLSSWSQPLVLDVHRVDDDPILWVVHRARISDAHLHGPWRCGREAVAVVLEDAVGNGRNELAADHQHITHLARSQCGDELTGLWCRGVKDEAIGRRHLHIEVDAGGYGF